MAFNSVTAPRKFFLLYQVGIGIFFFFFFLSCTKVIEPRVEDFYLAEIGINQTLDMEATLVIKIQNPNDFDIDITIKDLRHYRDGELLGYLLREEKVVLKGQDNTLFSLKVVFKKNIFISSFFSFLMSEDVEINIQGDLVVHHWTGDHDIALNKTFPLNIKNLMNR